MRQHRRRVDHAGITGQQPLVGVQIDAPHLARCIRKPNLHDPPARHLADHVEPFAGDVQGPRVDDRSDARMRDGYEAEQAFVGVDELAALVLAGIRFGLDREAEHDAVLGEHLAHRVEPLAVQLEVILEGVLDSGRGDRGRSPRRLGGMRELQPLRQKGEIAVERGVVNAQIERQVEHAALEPSADHQPPRVLHPVHLGLLLEIDDVDVHRVESERQRQLDQLAGASRQGKADRAQVTEHGAHGGVNSPGSKCGPHSMPDEQGILKRP